jgi:hypothetical protein
MCQAAFFLAVASSSTPMMSLSFMIRSSTPSILTSLPDHLPVLQSPGKILCESPKLIVSVWVR